VEFNAICRVRLKLEVDGQIFEVNAINVNRDETEGFELSISGKVNIKSTKSNVYSLGSWDLSKGLVGGTHNFVHSDMAHAKLV
jgi:hypothetical protein